MSRTRSQGSVNVVDSQSITTFSGLFVFFALVALFNRWFTLSGLLFTVAGAAGLGVFWERWSRLTGYDVQIQALWHPVAPTHNQTELLIVHALMLACGIGLLAALAWRHREASQA